jgi:hypothetical protein
MFSVPGNYLIRAAIASPDTETVSIDVTLKWNMNKSTAEVI